MQLQSMMGWYQATQMTSGDTLLRYALIVVLQASVLFGYMLTVDTGLCLLSCVMCDRVFCLKTKGRQVMQNACSSRWVIATLNSNLLCSLSLTRSSKHGCCVWWQSQICYKAPMSLRSFWLVVWGYYWGDILCFLCCCRHVILHQEKQKPLLTNIKVDEIQWEQTGNLNIQLIVWVWHRKLCNSWCSSIWSGHWQQARIHVSIKHFNKAGVYVFIHCFKCSYIKSEFPKIHATWKSISAPKHGRLTNECDSIMRDQNSHMN